VHDHQKQRIVDVFFMHLLQDFCLLDRIEGITILVPFIQVLFIL